MTFYLGLSSFHNCKQSYMIVSYYLVNKYYWKSEGFKDYKYLNQYALSKYYQKEGKVLELIKFNYLYLSNLKIMYL